MFKKILKQNVDEFLSKLFYQWGLIIYKFKWFFFFGSFLLTIILSFGFIWLHEQVIF